MTRMQNHCLFEVSSICFSCCYVWSRHIGAAVLMSAGFLNDDSIQNDIYCAETTERLVTDHWLFCMCGRVYHVEPSNSYNWDFQIEKQSNNNWIWLQNKQPKTLFISVRDDKQEHGWMAASETIFLLISVHQSMLLVLACPYPCCPQQKW